MIKDIELNVYSTHGLVVQLLKAAWMYGGCCKFCSLVRKYIYWEFVFIDSSVSR